jgi:hypothetical protein
MIIEYLRRQRAWSQRTFGPGDRTATIVAHIRKELVEIEAKPDDLSEWIDVMILAFEGAMRRGHDPLSIVGALTLKQAQNFARTWPDWRTVPDGTPIEHIRPDA